MRTLALLLALLSLPAVVVNAQDADAPEGAIIDAVEMSGFSLYSLSPGLQKEINSLIGAPLNREGLNQLASRIEGERPEMVAAVRSVARPDGKARVIFLVARISDDTNLSENINARYTVESVAIDGPANDVSQELHDDLQKLVGRRLDTEEADRLKDRLEDELPGREVSRRISKGTQPGTIRVVFEVVETPWIPFVPTRSKLVYHSEQGWSGVLDIPMTASRSRHRFTVGVAMDNGDDLLEEYSGFRLGFESRMLGTEKLGARLEFSRFNESWEDATLTALAVNPDIPEAYRTRLTFEPTVTFAVNPSLRFNGGVSLSELESLMHSPSSQTANAWVAGIDADHLWQPKTGARQKAEASYLLRAAVDGLDSDLDYTRHLGQARYQYDYRRNTAIASFSFGYISGQAPLFERFSLGDSTTLRGWNKYDVAPAGGERMFHSSVEYRYSYAAVFFDAGSVWDRTTDSKIRYSTGFGVHGDNFFVTLGFPLNADDVSTTFMMGVRF